MTRNNTVFWHYLVKKAFFGCERHKNHFDSQVKWILGILGPELHLDVPAIERSVLLLEVSTLQGPELHLDVSAL
jgi:hypothetical protein